MRLLIRCLLILIPMVNRSIEYEILVMTSSLGSKSHSIFLNSIAVELAKSGHQVTHLSSGHQSSTDGVTHHEVDLMSLPNLFNIEIRHLFQIDTIVHELVNVTYGNRFISRLLKRPFHPRYDVILLDACFTEHLLPLIHRMGAPFILVAPSHSMLTMSWNLNVPLSYSYFNYFGFREPMSFFHRLCNLCANLAYNAYFNSVLVPHKQNAVEHLFPNSPPIMDIQRNVSLVFINMDPVLQDSIPAVPFIVPIPCPQCAPAKPLPQDLQETLRSSGEHGVIYFAMGTIVKAQWIPRNFINKMMRVLSELPQLVIWNCDLNQTLPRNFRRVAWVPQQDLIAHPSVRLFINHAGLNSVQEAAFHGCPVLTFPICCDTFYSANQATKRGFGLSVDWKTVSSAQLRSIVQSLLNDRRYERSAERMRRVTSDRLSRPTRSAVYWVEYVARHKGAGSLKMNVDHYRIHHFLLMDVGLFLATVLLLPLLLAALYVYKHVTIDAIRHFTNVKTFVAIIQLGYRYFGGVILIKYPSYSGSSSSVAIGDKEHQNKL